MNGAEILVKSLEELGVKHVFGYTGAAILPVMDALGKSSIEIIVNSNEQSVAFSATGYSRSSNHVGVAVVTSGPAITNTLTAVADAYSDSIPLIVIAGQVPENKIGTDSFQHINVEKVFGGTAKRVVQVNNLSKIETIVKDAYYFSKAGKPGPVIIDIPINLQQNIENYVGNNIRNFSTAYVDERHLSDAQCQKFFSLLTSSKKPLLYLGGGLNSEKGSKTIREFNSLFNIPSVNTLMGKGVISEKDSYAMGLLGMFGTPYANKIIQENDFFFAIGVRWDDRVGEKVGFAIDAKIAYIDINPIKVHQIRSERNPDFSYIGDAASALTDLINYAKNNNISINIDSWRKRAVRLKKTFPLNYNRETDIIQQAEVVDILSRIVHDDTIITTGVGNHQLLAAQYFRMKQPKSFLSSGSFGTMGFGMPNAVGACIANPDSTVIVIDGDGSFRMNMGEIHTIGGLGLPIKILVLNNKSDGMVRNLEDTAYESRHSATERQSDIVLADLAKTCKFSFAERVSDKACLEDRIQEFLNTKGPSFLEVMTDIEEVLYPIVPVNASYSDMNMGPYIKKIKEPISKKSIKLEV